MKFFSFCICILVNDWLFAQTYAIKADLLIDGKSNVAKVNPVIIIKDKLITDINFTANIPAGAIIIDLNGYTILPGMIDVHSHLLADGGDYNTDLYNHSSAFRAVRAVKFLNIALQNGFTTMRDVCSEGAGYADVDLRTAVDSGYIIGPDIIASGKGISATGNYFPSQNPQNWDYNFPAGTAYATGVDECIKTVREEIAHGVDWIKLFADWNTPTFNYEEIKAIVDEAKREHVNVAAHCTSRQGIKMCIDAGARSIEHGIHFDDSLIRLAVERNVFWSPTLTAFDYVGIPLDSAYKYLNHAYKQHLKIVLGTDIGSFPWTINEARELEFYVKGAGLMPIDAIKTATLNAADLLEMQNKIGQIAPNFIANIIAVKGNPLNDISLLQHVAFVMKNGKIYKQPHEPVEKPKQ
jgi:imidazolonepropionase-like amidohydrolase